MYVYIYIYVYYISLRACSGQDIAHQKPTPRKSSWTFSGIFRWIVSGILKRIVPFPVDLFHWNCPMDFQWYSFYQWIVICVISGV